MKRSWLSIVAVLIMGALPLCCSGQSAPEAFCSKSASCSLLDSDQTQLTCIDAAESTLRKLGSTGGCEQTAGAFEEIIDCLSELSCGELRDFAGTVNLDHKCFAPAKALPAGAVTDCSAFEEGF